MRIVAIATGMVAAAAALIPATAFAGVTKVTWPVQIVVRAAPGTENSIRVTYGPAGGGFYSNFVSDPGRDYHPGHRASDVLPRGPQGGGVSGRGERPAVLWGRWEGLR